MALHLNTFLHRTGKDSIDDLDINWKNVFQRQISLEWFDGLVQGFVSTVIYLNNWQDTFHVWLLKLAEIGCTLI